ncbi:MAG: hypothetical protein ACAI38_24620 [Myxococcota bacterium]
MNVLAHMPVGRVTPRRDLDAGALAIAECLNAAKLSPDARKRVVAWALTLIDRFDVSVSALEHLLVTRALRDFAGDFDAAELKELRYVYARGHLELTGDSAPADQVVRLPLRALDDRRARVLQNAIFENRGLLDGYRPSVGQALTAGAAAAVCVTTPGVLPLAAGVVLASVVEHQIHQHIMHPERVMIRVMYGDKTGALRMARDFHFIHESVHHAHTYPDGDTVKFRDGSREKLDRLLERTGMAKFAAATDDGLQLHDSGARGSAIVSPTMVATAGALAGLSLPAAIALGLPMALMPMTPHLLHRFAHMSRTQAAQYLDSLAATGSRGRLESGVLRGIIHTAAFEGAARFHNQHHRDTKKDLKTNLSMLAVADVIFGTGRRADYDLLVALWRQDAIGFPAAPARG